MAPLPDPDYEKRHNSVVTSDLPFLDCIIIWDWGDQKYRTVRLYFVGQEKQRGQGVETALVQTENVLKLKENLCLFQAKKNTEICRGNCSFKSK